MQGIAGWESFESWLSRIESFPESSIWPLVDQIPPEWYDSAIYEDDFSPHCWSAVRGYATLLSRSRSHREILFLIGLR